MIGRARRLAPRTLRWMRWPPPEARCAECGFSWSTPRAEALGLLHAATGRCVSALAERQEPLDRVEPGTWSPSEYLAHLADALGICAERLVAVARVPGRPLVAYDQDELAVARRYARQSPAVSSWVLEQRAAEAAAVLDELDDDVEVVHEEDGPLTVGDLLRRAAHEAVHHELDIRRGLEPT